MYTLYKYLKSVKTKPNTSKKTKNETPDMLLDICLQKINTQRMHAEMYSYGNNPYDIGVNSLLRQKRFYTSNSNATITNCYKSEGYISKIFEDHIQIDDKLNVMIKLIDPQILIKITEGSRVEYLVFQSTKNKKCTVQLLRIILDDWNNQAIVNNIKYDQIDMNDGTSSLDIFPHVESRTYYDIESRTIIGTVVAYDTYTNVITFNTEGTSTHIRIDLNDVAKTFRPIVNDKLSLLCYVQIERTPENHLERIVNVVTLSPSRIQHSKICNVTSIHKDYIVLCDTYICLIEDLTNTVNKNDLVKADIIKTDMYGYTWRAINVERSVPVSIRESFKSNEERSIEFAVSISDNMLCHLDNMTNSGFFNMEISNNKDDPIEVVSVTHKVNNPIVVFTIIGLSSGCSFILNPRENKKLFFQIDPINFGYTTVYLDIKFAKFKLKRTITIIVGNTKLTDDNKTAAMTNAISSTLNNKRMVDHSVIPGSSKMTKPRFVRFRIAHFEPDAKMKEYYFNNYRDQKAMNLEYIYITEELNRRNYIKKFQTLLTFEELEHTILFTNYNMFNVHFEREGDYLSLTVPELMDRRPNLNIGDVARIHSSCIDYKETDLSYEGCICKIINNRILLKFSQQFHASYKSEEYNVQFIFSRFQFRKLHHAVIKAILELKESFLFPDEIEERSHPEINAELSLKYDLIIDGAKSDWFNPNLNCIQKKTIVNIIRGEAVNVPYIIFGPPGTGKTMTVVELILQLFTHYPNARILVAAPSNSAIDLIASRLIDTGVLLLNDLVRIVAYSVIDRELVTAKLAPFCATTDIAKDGSAANNMHTSESGIKMRCKSNYLQKFRVVLGTCSVIGTFHTMPLSVNHFTHVILDEAGQCSEPEAMLVISQVSKSTSKVILSGDPSQLSSVCLSSIAKNCGLTYSYLERIMKTKIYNIDLDLYGNSSGFNPKCITKLLYNYRSLPSILKMYSDTFYKSELIPTISEEFSIEAKNLKKVREILFPELKNCPPGHGTFFLSSFGQCIREPNSTSWCNPLEAKCIYSLITMLLNNGISVDKIGVIAPYTKQIKFIRQLFLNGLVDLPKIGTVEEFQGQERDIIFLSTVRSDTLKKQHQLIEFIQCPKRINVAISRSRYMVCIIGDPITLQTSQYWNSIINYCAGNNALIDHNFTNNHSKNIKVEKNQIFQNDESENTENDESNDEN